VKVGDDINNYNDIKYDMIVMESTNKEEFDAEGIQCNPKYNPGLRSMVTYDGQQVYHATFLQTKETSTGDILLS